MPVSSTARLRAAVDAIIAAGAESEALTALRAVIMRVSHKKARGGGASSKAKGRKLMVRLAELITSVHRLGDGDVFVKATSQAGCDLHMSPLADERFPFSVEGKNVERLDIWAAIRQANDNATPERPAVVFFTRAHHPIYVALSAEVFLELTRRAQSAPEKPAEVVPAGGG